MEDKITMRATFFFPVFVSWGLIVGMFAFVLGGRFYSPAVRSAVYEIPMADRREPWRVTTYRNKVYVLIEALSMPEEIIRKEGPTK